MQPIVHLLSVAGSSSQCARCTAMSKRTKEQCGRPALKVSKTQKCQFHGDRGETAEWLAAVLRTSHDDLPVTGRGIATTNDGSVKSRRQHAVSHRACRGCRCR